MNILYIVPNPPDLIRVRSYNLLHSLAAKGHSITIGTLWSNDQERLSIDRLKLDGFRVISSRVSKVRSIANCLQTIPSRTPLQVVYSWRAGFAKDLREFISSSDEKHPIDVIHTEHLRGAKYGLFLNKTTSLQKRPVSIWDSVDCISHLFGQLTQHKHSSAKIIPAKFDLLRTRPYEGWLLGQFDSVLVTSNVDKIALLSLYRGDDEPEVNVLPNGVDLEYFSPDDQIARDPATLVVSGKMSYHANIEMVVHLVRDIMPVVWATRPEVKLCIVGKDPPEVISNLAQNPLIEVTNFVPDIRPYLRRATISVSPIVYGAGIQNKVLEAMACGVPVIATPQAISALQVRPGNEVCVADSPASFAQAILNLLNDPHLQKKLSLAGRSYVEKMHNWNEIASELEEIYRKKCEATALGF